MYEIRCQSAEYHAGKEFYSDFKVNHKCAVYSRNDKAYHDHSKYQADRYQ